MADVYIFNCTNNNRVHGYTLLRDGANLPKDETHKHWQFNRQIGVFEDAPLIGIDIKVLLASLSQKGYHIHVFMTPSTKALEKGVVIF